MGACRMKMRQSEFAKLMGVQPSTVTRWVQSGRITRDINGRIDPALAKTELENSQIAEPHLQARAAQAAMANQKSNVSSFDTESKDEIARRYKIAITREREAKAELAAMERDKEAGLLIELAQVEFVIKDIGIALRSEIEAMPDRIAPQIAACAHDQHAIYAALTDAAHDLLNQISEHTRRKVQGITA